MKLILNKKKKFLLMLPLFLAPVVWLGYLILSKPGSEAVPPAKNGNAFNTKLPTPNIEETGKNKLELYMQAQNDSAKRKQLMEKETNEHSGYNPAPPQQAQESSGTTQQLALLNHAKTNEQKVNERLDQLMKELQQPAGTLQQPQGFPDHTVRQHKSQADQLEQRLYDFQQEKKGRSEDPEMDRVESLVERLLDIQHPERVKDRLVEKQEKQRASVMDVSTSAAEQTHTGNSFFGLESASLLEVATDNVTILAVTANEQTVTDGSTITLRLLQDVYAGGRHIPKGNMISGKCAIADQRVTVQLTDIICNNQIYPVALTVYDMDGLAGIHIERAPHSQSLKSGTDQAIQSMNMLNYDPSLTAQATTAGVQTVKNLLSRKVRTVRATIKAGHKVLLKVASH